MLLMAFAASTRALVAVATSGALVALYSGCGEQSSERRGGGEIPDLATGSGAVPNAGASGDMTDTAGSGGAAGAQANELVPWCAAYEIINCVCQQCHQNPPLHGAPLPLVTYANTQAPYPAAAPTKKVWQEMQAVITSRFMPFMGDLTVMPPVQPLSDSQRATMLSWLAQGALDTGGQDCAMTCDWSQGPPTTNP
jgi:hypothetical protein